jgi:putative SOS response-associated peptidase YedK
MFRLFRCLVPFSGFLYMTSYVAAGKKLEIWIVSCNGQVLSGASVHAGISHHSVKTNSKVKNIGVTQLDLDLVDFVQLAIRIAKIQFAVIIELHASTA